MGLSVCRAYKGPLPGLLLTAEVLSARHVPRRKTRAVWLQDSLEDGVQLCVNWLHLRAGKANRAAEPPAVACARELPEETTATPKLPRCGCSRQREVFLLHPLIFTITASSEKPWQSYGRPCNHVVCLYVTQRLTADTLEACFGKCVTSERLIFFFSALSISN